MGWTRFSPVEPIPLGMCAEIRRVRYDWGDLRPHNVTITYYLKSTSQGVPKESRDEEWFLVAEQLSLKHDESCTRGVGYLHVTPYLHSLGN